MTKRPTLVFDLDNTLFDTKSLKFLFSQIAKVNGYTEDQAREFYAMARNKKHGIIAITLDSYLQEVRRQCVKDRKKYNKASVLNVVEEIKDKKGELLLPGAEQLLSFCREEKMVCYLLSLGVPTWQKGKMRWVGLDKMFGDKNTVFTVKENGGKIEALRSIFGSSFNGFETVLFNDRIDESSELLSEFPNLIVFLRIDRRDSRFKLEYLEELKNHFGKRVFASDDLGKLFRLFKKYVGK